MPPCQIVTVPGLTPYATALNWQRDLAQRRQRGDLLDTLLLLEHPPTITLGRGSRPEDLLTTPDALRGNGIEVVETDRGGEISYHAPGQLVGYPILDLRDHGQDLHKYLRDLEEVLIRVLQAYDIPAGRMPGLTGVWVGGAKVAAMGVKVSRWISLHGFALNINLDLTPMRRDFVPCGIHDKGVTSLQELCPKRHWSRPDLEVSVVAAFAGVFGVTPIPTSAGILTP